MQPLTHSAALRAVTGEHSAIFWQDPHLTEHAKFQEGWGGVSGCSLGKTLCVYARVCACLYLFDMETTEFGIFVYKAASSPLYGLAVGISQALTPR